MRLRLAGPELQVVAWLTEVLELGPVQVAELVPGWVPLKPPP